MLKNKVWLKFFTSYVLVIMVSLIVWQASSSYFIRSYFFIDTREKLLNVGNEINQLFSEEDIPVNSGLLRILSRRFDGWIYVTDINGVLVNSSGGSDNPGLTITPQVMEQIKKGNDVAQLWDQTSTGEAIIAVATPMTYEGSVVGAVILIAPVKGIDVAVAAVRSQVIKGGLIALLLGAIASLAVSLRMTKQIRAIIAGTSKFASGNHNYRIPVITDDEFGEMAISFNNMAESIASANERRKSLLAGVSHDVRTPLTVIQGYIEAMRDGVIAPEDMPAVLDLIKREAGFIEKMVGDLIDLSRMEAENYRLSKEKVDLVGLVNQVVDRLKPFALAQNNEIHLNLPDNLIFEADPTRIEQMLTNLIKNSLQFTTNGWVNITCRILKDTVQISVKDNGIGIESDKLMFIFDSFYKADPARVKEKNESGLGLAIVKRIVELHGGDINVVSVPGSGTEFTIKLPR